MRGRGGSMARERLRAMEEERKVLEAEAAELTAALQEAAGEAGLTGKLVDAQGFPIPDIDLHQVATHRKRLAEIRTDHTRLTNDLAEALAELHSGAALAPRPPPQAPTAAAARKGAAQLGGVVKWGGPFALVTDIAEGSPAAAAGLNVGDQICKLGEALEVTDVSRVVGEFEGRPLRLEVLRQGAEEELELVPQQWSGAGLLGCQLRPL